MGKEAIKIIDFDINNLITMLNKAFADEWLAYYQYWIGAKIAKGPMRMSVITELEEHANEELEHSKILADRIIQLGGSPILTPEEWYKMTNCGYLAPKDFHVKKILEQNIQGERCAIDVYKKMLDEIGNKDIVTYHLILEILEDELEHEEDLENLLEDINLIK